MIFPAVCILLLPQLAWASDTPTDFEKYWPQWRGYSANGVSRHASPPVEWTENENVRWKADIPGQGHASPVIWGDRVIILTAIETDRRDAKKAAPSKQEGRRRGPPTLQPSGVMKFTVIALKRQDGGVLWQKVVREEQPHEGIHPAGSWASNSPVTDGEYIYASFGSRGLYCLDMENGNLLWEKDLGDMTIKLGFGEGSSPVLHGDRIIINSDHEGQSFIVALDKRSGRELWRVDRDEITSWSTPIVVESKGRFQVITSATKRIRSYDLETGELIWQSSGMTRNVIPSPVATGDIVYLTSGFRGSALQAIRFATARDDVAGGDAIVWTREHDTPYTPSPLLYDSFLYLLKRNSGIVTAINAHSGEELYGPQRLPGIDQVFASPVGADGRVYIVSTNGATVVLRHGSEYEVLAQNTLDDSFSASPAIVDSELYLRGNHSLYCIASQ